MSCIMPSHGIPATRVREVQEMIDAASEGKRAPLSTFLDIADICEKDGYLKEVHKHPDEVMVHMSNRGTLGLNGHNCHKNLSEIHRVGCDPSELKGAYCMECAPYEPKRQEQFDFNKRVIAQSKGLLAPLTGREDSMSIGCGHFTGGVRAISHGCRTPYKQLADSAGRLSAEQFTKTDKRMAKCIEGWNWKRFDWRVDAAWPLFADLGQKALNASHGVTSRSTELEVMVSMALADAEKTQGTSFDDICQTTLNASPACASYIKTVGELAKQISGGKEAPTLIFLDRVQKSHGENKNLGQEFVESVAGLSLSKTTKLNYVKASLVAVNLIGARVTDGISKTIVKTDVERLKSKEKKADVLMVDERTKLAQLLAGNAYQSSHFCSPIYIYIYIYF
jgi:hypothetical protein